MVLHGAVWYNLGPHGEENSRLHTLEGRRRSKRLLPAPEAIISFKEDSKMKAWGLPESSGAGCLKPRIYTDPISMSTVIDAKDAVLQVGAHLGREIPGGGGDLRDWKNHRPEGGHSPRGKIH